MILSSTDYDKEWPLARVATAIRDYPEDMDHHLEASSKLDYPDRD